MADSIGIRLCHHCQRRTIWAGSFVEMLADILEMDAKGAQRRMIARIRPGARKEGPRS